MTRARRQMAFIAATCCVFLAAGTSAANAADTPSNLVLTCKFNDNAIARVDYTGFDVTRWNHSVDASSAVYRSMKGDGATPATFQPDRIQLILDGYTVKGAKTAIVWEAKGAALGDGISVSPYVKWYPSGVNSLDIEWTSIRLVGRSLGKETCTSANVPLV